MGKPFNHPGYLNSVSGVIEWIFIYCSGLGIFILITTFFWMKEQVPDFLNAKIDGRPVKEIITDIKWLEEEFTERVQKVHLYI